jgi:hypothetical protein
VSDLDDVAREDRREREIVKCEVGREDPRSCHDRKQPRCVEA